MKAFKPWDTFQFHQRGTVHMVEFTDGVPVQGETVLINETQHEVLEVQVIKCLCHKSGHEGAILVKGKP